MSSLYLQANQCHIMGIYKNYHSSLAVFFAPIIFSPSPTPSWIPPVIPSINHEAASFRACPTLPLPTLSATSTLDLRTFSDIWWVRSYSYAVRRRILRYGRRTWTIMKSCTIVEARILWRIEGGGGVLVGYKLAWDEWLLVSSSWEISSFRGREPWILSCSSCVKSPGRPRSRYVKPCKYNCRANEGFPYVGFCERVADSSADKLSKFNPASNDQKTFLAELIGSERALICELPINTTI